MKAACKKVCALVKTAAQVGRELAYNAKATVDAMVKVAKAFCEALLKRTN